MSLFNVATEERLTEVNRKWIVCGIAAPRFESVENQPHDVNASVGDDVIVRCMAYANPSATVQWFQNGNELDRKCRSY